MDSATDTQAPKATLKLPENAYVALQLCNEFPVHKIRTKKYICDSLMRFDLNQTNCVTCIATVVDMPATTNVGMPATTNVDMPASTNVGMPATTNVVSMSEFYEELNGLYD